MNVRIHRALGDGNWTTIVVTLPEENDVLAVAVDEYLSDPRTEFLRLERIEDRGLTATQLTSPPWTPDIEGRDLPTPPPMRVERDPLGVTA